MTEHCPWPDLLASDGLPVLENTPGYLIRRAHQVHASLWQVYVRQNLTAIQFGVLLVVDQHQEVDQTTVAQLMSLDKNTVTDVLRRLRSRGLIFCRRDSFDGRRMLTRLSDRGRRALGTAKPAVRAIQDRLLEPLDVRERQTFLALLCKGVYLGAAVDRRGKATCDSTASGQPTSGRTLRLDMAPGHLIRRMQQLHTMYWLAEVSSELTSPQFSLLLVLVREAPIGQGPLGEHCSLDRATAAAVLSRMYQRGLVSRVRDAVDGRRYKLTLSASGHTTLHMHIDGVLSVQRRLMEPLSQQERGEIITSIAKVGHVAP